LLSKNNQINLNRKRDYVRHKSQLKRQNKVTKKTQNELLTKSKLEKITMTDENKSFFCGIQVED
jgi:hypothetical protein